MKRFSEFLSKRDGVIEDPTVDNIDQEDILQRIVRQHGQRFRSLLKSVISRGEVDDDAELRGDLKQLLKSIVGSAPDQFPPTKRPEKREPDIVSRPSADGGSSGGSTGGGGEGGSGEG